ncbi:thioredoxin domain-containing protein [Amycolatopsis mongoliensis]|uniref:Thioredoxin domain-containing protein n=1 Tax=Amycolatopsis mongoliensis TaxID=715475 RepID=A0A9Y2NIQ9_9PSEU|nr:thioredoxin domain-containing protein [Amycolatopsis sp. 4-36]WIY03194.1 thioredoxin domain-containing protein [Amycolatopsis sp. 4-36]
MAQARGASGDKRKWIIGIGAVVVVAALVIGGVIWTISDKNKTEGQIINPGQTTSSLAGDVTQKRDGVVVTVGKAGAKASIDVYADFLCPICGQFEKTYKTDVEQAINDGKLQVRYHMVPLLNDRSDPPGYSLDSANAALAAADAGKFLQFHDALFANQPEEGKRGYDKAQLIKLGQDVGITDPAFSQTVNAGTYDQQINAAFQQIENDPKLAQDFGNGQSGFGTPTVTANGKIVSWQDPGWLAKVTG